MSVRNWQRVVEEWWNRQRGMLVRQAFIGNEVQFTVVGVPGKKNQSPFRCSGVRRGPRDIRIREASLFALCDWFSR